MRARRLTAVAAATVVLIVLAAWLWHWPAPLELTVVSAEPARIRDDAGAEMVLATLSLRNRDSVSIEFGTDTTVAARVANRWVEVREPFYLHNPLAPGTNSEALFLLPAGANACRLRLKYQGELFKWRVWRRLPAAVVRVIGDSPALRKWLWPQGNSRRRPPQWKEVTLETEFPQNAGGPRP